MKRLLAIFMTLCMVLGLSGVNVWATEEAKWQEETPMPTARSYASSCVVGDKIYVMGGSGNTSSSIYLNAVEIYNTKTKTWSTGKPMPETKGQFSAQVIGGKIYAIGGFIQGTTVSNSILIYDVKTDTWVKGKSMPTARFNFDASVVGNKIYVIGGQNSGRLPIDTMEIYDTLTDTWSTGKSIPIQKSAFTSSVVGNKIYVIGGTNNTVIDATVEIYDTLTDTWSTGTSILYIGYYSSSEVVGDKIYVLGGLNTSPLDKVQIYSTTSNKWVTGQALLTTRYTHSSALVNGILYVLGGSGSAAGASLNTVESLKVAEPVIDKPLLSVLLNIDETVQLSVSYNLADNAELTWSSTNEAVATVDKNGKVTAVGEGQADIYAQNADGTFKEFISVKVVPGTANGMRLAAHLKVGEKVKLHLFDDPSKVTWKSMDESIATVSEAGQVTAAKKGLAIIQGELEGQTYQIYVRVNG